MCHCLEVGRYHVVRRVWKPPTTKQCRAAHATAPHCLPVRRRASLAFELTGKQMAHDVADRKHGTVPLPGYVLTRSR